MTLKEKLQVVKENYPEIYTILKAEVPRLLKNPENPSKNDLDHYNFWIDGILDEDAAQELYEI